MMEKICDMLMLAWIKVEIFCWAKMQELEQELLLFMILQDIKRFTKEWNADEENVIKLPEKNNRWNDERNWL